MIKTWGQNDLGAHERHNQERYNQSRNQESSAWRSYCANRKKQRHRWTPNIYTYINKLIKNKSPLPLAEEGRRMCDWLELPEKPVKRWLVTAPTTAIFERFLLLLILLNTQNKHQYIYYVQCCKQLLWIQTQTTDHFNFQHFSTQAYCITDTQNKRWAHMHIIV